MGGCPKCRSMFPDESGRCPVCGSLLLSLLDGGIEVDEEEETGEPEPLALLLEESLPEMAGMIQEFLENCGIDCVVQNESIGLLYRPTTLARSRVLVRESDYDEARELIAHFFKPN